MIKSYKTVFCMFGISYSQNRILQQEREQRKWDFEINHLIIGIIVFIVITIICISCYCKWKKQKNQNKIIQNSYQIQVESQNTIIYSQNEQVKQLSHYIIPIEKYEDFKKWMDDHNCKIHD